MFKLDLYDLLVGFIDFIVFHPISREETTQHHNATWTSVVYNYFMTTGRLLGFDIEREMTLNSAYGQCDLIWTRTISNKRLPALHIESESGSNLETSLSKVRHTTAKGAIVVTYSESIAKLYEMETKLKTKLGEWDEGFDVLFIIIPLISEEKEYPIIGILRKGTEISTYKTIVPMINDYAIKQTN